MKRILIYGAGKQAEYFLSSHNFNDEEIIGVVMTQADCKEWRGYTVYSIGDIHSVSYDEIWLVNRFAETLDNCLEQGVEKSKIVICNKCIWDSFSSRSSIIDFRYMKGEAEEYEKTATYCKSRDLTVLTRALNIPNGQVYYSDYSSQFGGVITAEDYFRFATLKLLAAEIRDRKVDGVCAELGVYQGKFAKCINREFRDKLLYLFDTFEGMPKQDMKYEEEQGYTDPLSVKDYSDTSVDVVLGQMPYPEKCVVRKGYFPDTVPKEDLKYAFVSIRPSMYKPVLEGLRYFYPRLSPGGYIMIGVYNSPIIWKGTKEAVREFEKEAHIVKVPLADAQGSIVIGK